MKITVKEVPTRDWMSEKAIKVVNDFNACGKKLSLVTYEEPTEDYTLDDILDEGMYDFEYPDCPEAVELETMIEELANGARFIGFDIPDLEV